MNWMRRHWERTGVAFPVLAVAGTLTLVSCSGKTPETQNASRGKNIVMNTDSSHGVADSSETSTKQGPVFTNHLIHESSPYLLQHTHNPVDWHPWGGGCLFPGKEAGQARVSVHRICHLPLVSRHGT